MRRTLLILSPSRVSSTCVEKAIASARRTGGRLLGVYILDTTQSDDVLERVQDMGFLGDVPSSRFMDAVLEEYRRRGTDELDRIGELAKESGVDFESELVEGDFLSQSMEAVERTGADEIFVARRERPALSRIMTGSDVKRLSQDSSADVRVYEADSRVPEPENGD